MTTQQFRLHDIEWDAVRPADTPYFLSNPHMYMVASLGGDLTAYGDEHTVGKMGGLWAHPIRVADGWCVRVDGHPLASATSCTTDVATVVRRHTHAGLQITTHETLVPQQAVLVAQVHVHNSTAVAWHGEVALVVATDVRGCWFGGMPVGAQSLATPTGVELQYHADQRTHTVVLRATLTGAWRQTAAGWEVTHDCQVAPMSSWVGELVIAVSHTTAVHARKLAQRWHGKYAVAANASVTHATQMRLRMPQLQTPDADLNAYWQIAGHNMHQLHAELPDLGTYLYAGIPEYPQLFGCDTTYAVPGLMAAGMGEATASALHALAAYAHKACGRVPHEITTNGRVFHPGNAQETPQFAVACWQYFQWSGDMVSLRMWYPVCAEGMEHVMGVLTGQHWPYGDGMVERHGMGPFKLDSVCYIHQALCALAAMAQTLGDADAAHTWQQYADALAQRFEAAWWLPDESLYADSMHRDGALQLDGHWTVIVPAQTGIAPPARQHAVYQRVARDFVNAWGLMHTRGVDERVWTLPTGLLALTAFAHADVANGVRWLKTIGETTRHGTLGLMKELIPQGICFVQLWSTGLFAQGVVAGLFGIVPDAHAGHITITPRIPVDWPEMALTGVWMGHFLIDIAITHHDITVRHTSMGEALTVTIVHAQVHPTPQQLASDTPHTWRW
jgi:hypothetical protein